jgi:hypothetical protein
VTTRRQAARERKRRLHGEGDEAALGRPEAVAERKPARGASRAKATKAGPRLSRDGDVIVNGRQRIRPPTWKRTLLRTAVFMPIMWVIVHFLFAGQDMTLRDEAQLIGMYAIVTIGVMHYSETFRYRRLDRKLNEAGQRRR